MSDKKLVIIPTYDEKENIRTIIEAILALDVIFDILVVDDNSPDGTIEQVRLLQKEYPNRIFLEIRKSKMGLGTAYIHGFRWALERDYQYIFEMDADFSHNPKDLPRLYYECSKNDSDVAIGSRYIKGVNVINWPFYRILLSYGASFYVRIITGMTLKDPTAGFICYRRKVLEAIDFDKIRFVGYAFQVEMKYKAFIRKFKITEISIIFTDRLQGKSKMNGSIIKEAVWGVFTMRLRHLFNKE
ncbi:polyprenol monophosphomannose synthase [Capnocytophaga catalasegens]|uniref:Dolichyl-phosphate beta-D-mannosyltransferase n=1 Tax=Capnocytophaga catalasegens TaxID=1004260 RepID=A0AAV5B053_9FLAO|nr:polyprenol monophosphomannose synthase [Capnocytophaga catalasegens]GIZ14157.1 dolichyl-phosphate beta-D-mannosyltransferase [Capnocytophaga catalasegens]GJM51488.1 dolichyl-phosphate beta-D-mannosyltransferase [Capnocytophaga catalasegens]GJM53996.1 dolichyl-phosphate beta-D-mannosyltransferase [Capnocytophaga catalasegens]